MTGRGAVGLLVVGLAASCFAAPLVPLGPEGVFARANAAYEQGRFEDAVDGYRSLLRYRYHDAVLEYNLANAEFRAGRLGLAILHYERARRLDPTDPDILANLEYARTFRRDRVEPREEWALWRWLREVQDRVGPDPQAWLVLALVWLLAALVAWCSARPAGWKGAWAWTLAVLVSGILLCTASWYVTLHRLDGVRRAVVLQDVVEVLAGPGANNAGLFTVHEGLLVEVRADREEWLQVSLPNGLNGWIPRAAVGLV